MNDNTAHGKKDIDKSGRSKRSWRIIIFKPHKKTEHEIPVVDVTHMSKGEQEG